MTTVYDLEQAINERHSTRMFLSRPVPRALVEVALAPAQPAPSNASIHPWRMVFISGVVLDRLKKARLDAVDEHVREDRHRDEFFPEVDVCDIC